MQRSNPAVAKFYNSPEWKKVRLAYRKYRFGLCERCGRAGEIVHHKKYITAKDIYNPNITLNFNNLELLCRDCHNKEHFEQNNFTADGELKPESSSAFELCKVFKK